MRMPSKQDELQAKKRKEESALQELEKKVEGVVAAALQAEHDGIEKQRCRSARNPLAAMTSPGCV